MAVKSKEHKDRMALRRLEQRNRSVTVRKFKVGKYTPAVEDMKHLEQSKEPAS